MSVNGRANSAHSSQAGGNGFLSFNSLPPRLVVTAEDDEFDEQTLQNWRDEGFDVIYKPLGEGGKQYAQDIKSVADELKLGEIWGIIAYGDAATACLDIAQKPLTRCNVLICYYPTSIPNPNAKYPSQLNLVVHIAGSQGLAPKFKYYRYPNVEPGFAEYDLEEYSHTAAELSWTRSLTAVRKGFKRDVDIESVREAHAALSLGHRDPNATIETMRPDAHVTYLPTLIGGAGKRALHHFYKDFFMPGLPPSFNTRLVSRTSGVDRVVDEFVVSFNHSVEMKWILPGVAPTNRNVEIAMVSIVAVKGGKLVHEHVYWDQASVLMQIGALDPKNVPKQLKDKGCEKLPIVGPEASRKVLDPDAVLPNDLLDDW